jgi:hypothetical protein
MHWEQRLREHAERHEGLVAKFHLSDFDCTWDHWVRARRNGRWEALSERVLRLRGSPSSDAQRVLAAVLDASPGGMLHGESALAWCSGNSLWHTRQVRGASWERNSSKGRTRIVALVSFFTRVSHSSEPHQPAYTKPPSPSTISRKRS